LVVHSVNYSAVRRAVNLVFLLDACLDCNSVERMESASAVSKAGVTVGLLVDYLVFL
jgi:hypothetical protein